MYVIFIRCDKRTSNNKHKRQSQNDVQYKAAKLKKLFHLTKRYKERIRKDFLWRSVEYSGSWCECPRVLKLARFLVGGSKWFKACVGAHKLQNRSWSDLFISFVGHKREHCKNGWTDRDAVWGVDTCGAQGTVCWVGPGSPMRKDTFWRVTFKHADTCQRSIFLTSFARGSRDTTFGFQC